MNRLLRSILITPLVIMVKETFSLSSNATAKPAKHMMKRSELTINLKVSIVRKAGHCLDKEETSLKRNILMKLVRSIRTQFALSRVNLKTTLFMLYFFFVKEYAFLNSS